MSNPQKVSGTGRAELSFDSIHCALYVLSVHGIQSTSILDFKVTFHLGSA